MSLVSCRSEPTARNFNARHRPIISSITSSSVSWYSPVDRATRRRIFARFLSKNVDAATDRLYFRALEKILRKSRS
jgi:hypothetical protein